MTTLPDALRAPIALPGNRIPRFYRGGLELARFRGESPAFDDGRPEDWVGSATRAWTPPGRPSSEIGLSRVVVGERETTLEKILAEAPGSLAGAALVERAGPTLGVLVKLLDAGERLPVHCHPTRRDAAAVLGSQFGKTEAWIVLGTRHDAAASVWIGFRERVHLDRLRDWIERQDTAAMLDALVEHRVDAGDVLLVPAGTPHAIGSGVFLLELQEPTDFSIVAETAGYPIDTPDATLRLGWERAITFFETVPAASPFQQPDRLDRSTERLLGAAADPFFRALRQRIDGRARPPFEPGYAVGVVLGGSGSVGGGGNKLELSRGTTFALPAAAVKAAHLDGSDLELVWCLGPDPSALDGLPTGRPI